MMRKAEHLRQVADAAPEPNGTAVIMPLIEGGLRALSEAETRRRVEERGTDKKLNPSISDAGKCHRRNVLTLLNVKETNPPDTDSQLRFLFGHSAEDALAKLIEAYQGATYLREQRVEIAAGATKITGRSDFGAVRLEFGESIVELKQTNGMALGFLLKRGSPNEDHIKQLNLYLHATGKPRGILVYVVAGQRKGEPMMHAWIVEYDGPQALVDIAMLQLADAEAKVGTIPPIPTWFQRDGWPCNYCSYQGFCWDSPLDATLDQELAASLERAKCT